MRAAFPLYPHGARCRSRRAGAGEGGFTLIELIVGIALLGLIAATVVFSFNGNKSKGQLLFSEMVAIGDAATRFQLDTSCIPFSTRMLFDATAVSGSTNNSCGADVSSTWNGPYMKAVPVDSSGNVLSPQIGPAGYFDIQLASPQLPGGGARQYAVFAQGFPVPVIDAAMRACTAGTRSPGASKLAGVCAEEPVMRNLGTLEYVFSTND